MQPKIHVKAHIAEQVNKIEMQPLLPKTQEVHEFLHAWVKSLHKCLIFKKKHPSSLLAWGGFEAGGHLW